MARTTITALAGLMTLSVVSACAQTTSDTAPAEAADSTTSATSTATDTTTSTDTTAATGSTTPAPAPATGPTGTAQQPAAPAGSPIPATQADITAGATVNDSAGVMLGTVQSVDATGVVLKSGTQSVKLPVNSFGKTATGLMIGITKADFDAQVEASKATQPAPGASPAPSTPPSSGGTSTPPQ